MGFLRKLFGGDDTQVPRDLGRNDPCWCGSGKKYKHCHLAKDQAKQKKALDAACKVGRT